MPLKRNKKSQQLIRYIWILFLNVRHYLIIQCFFLRIILFNKILQHLINFQILRNLMWAIHHTNKQHLQKLQLKFFVDVFNWRISSLDDVLDDELIELGVFLLL